MKLKIFFLFALALVFTLPANAVLKEDSLANSLAVLRHELITYHVEQNDLMTSSHRMGKEVFATMKDIMERSGQNAIMLYSQQPGNVFDLAYACHEAKEQYEEFRKKTYPFTAYIAKSNAEIARYDSLINSLMTMPTFFMSSKAKTDRNVCLTLAVNIRRMLVDNNQDMRDYVMYYQYTEKKLRNLNDYANAQYAIIQENIFKNGGDNYISILKNIGLYLSESKLSLRQKYKPESSVDSQWDVKWIIWLFIAMAIYGIMAAAFNFLNIRVLVTKVMEHERFKDKNQAFLAKRTYIIMAGTIITFGIIMAALKAGIFTQSNFVKMAANLLLEFSWLLAAILISLLLRVKDEELKSTYRTYAPLAVIGFIVFAFRIVLIPSELVNLLFPPLLVIATIWQFYILRKLKRHIPSFDFYLTTVTMIVFAFSVVSSFIGFTLLAVQAIIWWIMMLTCVLTLACIHNWLTVLREKFHIKDKPVTKVWWFRLIYFVVLPSLLVLSVLLSVYWAADIFDLSDTTWKIFTTNFVDSQYISISILAIAQVIIASFLFNYLNHFFKDFVHLYMSHKDPTTAESRSTMIIKLVQIIIWGIWLLLSLAIFHVSNTWLVVISGGLSTGIGFAMKDILENIYYGISLMAGRVKIGDYIVCDGVRGRVSSISYTSTLIEAIDGSIIAFTNSQLFTKNYKNMTKNHGYELDVLEVGVAYGTNIQQAKDLLQQAIMQLDCIDRGRGVKVVLKSFDDSCITLKVLIWVNVLTQYGDDGIVMECIYDTLSKNNIEIPFPQRDIHIISQ